MKAVKAKKCTSKKCTLNGQLQDFDKEFYRDSSTPDGRARQCVTCIRLAQTPIRDESKTGMTDEQMKVATSGDWLKGISKKTVDDVANWRGEDGR